jgi:acetyl esterase/lipase
MLFCADPELRCDIYLPDGAAPRGVAVLIHAGGWRLGSRTAMADAARALAVRGWAVVAPQYRLLGEAPWPAQIEDVKRALRWTRAARDRFGDSCDHLAVVGYSAGGHLAALLGGMADDPRWGGPELAVRAVVAGGTPSDLPAFCHGKLVPALIGRPCTEALPSYRDASPIAHVSPGDPPVFLYHAGWDRLVPIDQAERYQATLDHAGVTNEYFVIRGHGHISGFFFDGAAVDAALAFLDRYLR